MPQALAGTPARADLALDLCSEPWGSRPPGPLVPRDFKSPLIREYTLNSLGDPIIIQGIFLNQGGLVLGNLTLVTTIGIYNKIVGFCMMATYIKSLNKNPVFQSHRSFEVQRPWFEDFATVFLR